MPPRPAVRRLAMATAALVAGAGFATAVATPAFALAVTDTASLNAAIVANEPLLEITADFTLTADIEFIDYDVTIVGNDHTIDADGFDAFDIEGSATVSDLTIVDANDDGVWVVLLSGDIATVTDVSTTGAGRAGIFTDIRDGASASITGGAHTDALIGIDVGAEGTGSATVTGVAVTDAEYGLDLSAINAASITVSEATITAGPNYNASFAGSGVYVYLEDDATASLSGVTIASQTDPADGAFLEGIETYQDDATTIVLTDMAITGGRFGMFVEVYDTDGVFSLVDSSVSGAAEYGVRLNNMTGTGTISGTTITANGFSNTESGLEIRNYGGTPVTVSNSTIAGNAGTGIDAETYDAGTSLAITGSTVSDNGGGGILVSLQSDQAATVTDTAVAGNDYVGLEYYASGDSSVIVTGSTFSGNLDGGLWAWLYDTASSTVVNSTVSGNLPGNQGWALWSGGNPDTQFTVLHTTVTDNTGLVPTGFEDGPVFVSHSIFSGNDSNGAYGDFWVDSSAGTDVTVEWSLIGELVDDSNGANYTANAGVRTGVNDPGLEPLADNGGATLTHLITPASAALNAGNPAITGQPATDQRGGARILGAAIDLGAVEVIPTLPATGSDVSTTALVGGLLLLLGGLVVAVRLRRRVD